MSSTQNALVLESLKQGPLTALDAINNHKILRLAARVYDLRHQGHVIATETRVVGSAKDRKNIAVYHLMKLAR